MAHGKLTNAPVRKGQNAQGSRGGGAPSRGLLPNGAKVGIQTGDGGRTVTQPGGSHGNGLGQTDGELVINSRPTNKG
jgi:hypothetical protein